MVNLSKLSNADEYQKKVVGYFGSFQTDSGIVSYLQTKARLDYTSPDDHARLIAELVPVREVLDSKAMDFDQLLQRDLDDHRVATELIPYLLSENKTGASYFPPIVAVLLPFLGNQPLKNFEGEPFENELVKSAFGDALASGYRGDYRVDRLYDDAKKELSNIHLGQFNWQPEKAKFVVIDGQHRAMAVLALYRTLSDKWTGNGERYKAFYAESINRQLEKYTPDQKKKLLDSIEIPVNIIYFPIVQGESADQHVAARKLFVDVNQNARKPSKSRIMLLSDRDLISIFLRSTLNDFRANKSFPISSIEYDNPDSDEQSNSKWCAISNAYILGSMILRTISGPKEFYDVSKDAPKGQSSKSDLRTELGNSLYLKDVLNSTIEEDGIKFERKDIAQDNFPPKVIPELRKQYSDGWGYFIKNVFISLEPYRAHAEALHDLISGWSASDSQSRLASDSISEGAGVFWTLREGNTHFNEMNKFRREQGLAPLPPTDAIKAWQILEDKKVDFEKLRAKKFLGGENKRTESEAAYSMYGTAACQIGICLSAKALWNSCLKGENEFERIPGFSDKLFHFWNLSLNKKNDRKLFLVKDHAVMGSRFNLLEKLDTPRSVSFRYFWLELLASSDIREELEQGDFIDCVKLDTLVSKARCSYRDYLISQRANIIKKTTPELSEKEVLENATEEIDKYFVSGLKKFFNFKKSDYDAWKVTCVSGISAELTEASTSAVDNGPSEDPAASNDDDSMESILNSTFPDAGVEEN